MVRPSKDLDLSERGKVKNEALELQLEIMQLLGIEITKEPADDVRLDN